jgi:hypothetical protein
MTVYTVTLGQPGAQNITSTGTTTARSLADRGADRLNVRDFGAAADSTTFGNGTDDRAAFQACIDECIVSRKKMLVPAGAYRIGTPGLTVDLTAVTNSTDARPSIEGDGIGLSLIYFDDGDYTGLRWRGGTSSGLHAKSVISGLHLRKQDVLGIGLKVEDAAYFTLRDVECAGWNYGVDLADCLSTGIFGLVARFNNYGLKAARDGGSQPNAISLYSCVFGNNNENGLVLTRPGDVNMFGGSVESNGAAGDDVTKGGVYISEGPSQAGVSFAMFGTYVENNVGDAAILISNSSGHQGVYGFHGTSFQRVSNTTFSTNLVKASGTTRMVLSFKSCAFKRLGTYVADAGRPYIDVSGATDIAVDLDPATNYQMDATESWAITMAVAALPVAPFEGQECDVTDSNTATWGATVAAGGANHVKVRYNGTNWTVVGA